jgi:hypothetical protein
MEKQELGPIEYSEPVCRCESSGTITNSLGQKLAIRVSGQNRDLVEEYMRTVRIAFVVMQESENAGVWEEPSEELDPKTRQYIERGFKTLELHPELDLQVDLDVTDTQGLELPYDLNIDIDPTISGGASHYYSSQKKCKKEKVTLGASVNGVYGVLSGTGIAPIIGQADVFSPDPPLKKAKYTGEAGAEVNFYFTVTGLRANNTYSLSASIKMVR